MKELRNSLLCVVLVVATLSLSILIVRPSCAQSTEPSPPKFSIQTPNASTIQLVIENQAFINSSSVNSLVYYFRVKARNSDIWMKDGDYTLQSNSDITIISISPESEVGAFLYTPFFDNSTSFDFQVQAVTGFYNVTWETGYMGNGMPELQPGYWQIIFNPAESSAWSPTQTVTFPPIVPLSTVPDSSSSTSTSTPTAPEISIIAILPLFLLVISVAVILRHRKTVNLKQ